MRGIVGLLRLGAILVGGGVVVALTLAVMAPRLGDLISANASSSAEIDLDELALRSIVYDTNGDEFDVLYDVENRELVGLRDVSKQSLISIIVVEDEGYWDHNGVDARAIIRALVQNVSSGGVEQGGSTITQQLVKNGVIGDARDLLDRKVPEAAMAIRLERQMDKKEILEAYVNTVYFGSGAYGVRAGAEIYFGVRPEELDWAQSALLAGLISNPTAYDPTRFPDAAKDRRTVALRQLLDTGHITEAEFEFYDEAPLPSQRNIAAEWEPTNYFIEEVRRRLLDDPRLGATRQDRSEALFGGGLRVFTTYDPVVQEMAERAVLDNLPEDERFFTAALASVEPGTGYVRAIVGGPGFDKFEFNIATQKGRPTGSSFKPFVLAAAMENGYVPWDEVNGIGSCNFPNPGGFPNPYIASNFGGGRGSVATVRSQTLRSSNCAYLRLGDIVGQSNVVDVAGALGITTRLEAVISLPLGPFDVTPLDMATAYAAFQSDGVTFEPTFILRVEDREGNVILENTPRGQRAISAQSARLVTSVLEANIRGGTGTRARIEGQPAAGKTGTAQDFGDAWFVGYTPYLATAVWMGNPDERIPMRDVAGIRGVTGGSIPAMIWGQFNNEFHAELPERDFENPDGTRAGRRIRTDIEEEEYEDLLQTPCGKEGAEVDTDDDGIFDACENTGTFEYDEGIGLCPELLIPTDSNQDGEIDVCVVPTTTTTTTTTSTTTTTIRPPRSTTTTTTTTTTLPDPP